VLPAYISIVVDQVGKYSIVSKPSGPGSNEDVLKEVCSAHSFPRTLVPAAVPVASTSRLRDGICTCALFRNCCRCLFLCSVQAQKGGLFQDGGDFQPKVCVAGNVFTGQNPSSAAPLADEIVKALA